MREGLRAGVARLRVATTWLAVVYVLAYVATALVRMRFPFELEWMEGSMVDHVRRVLAHQPVYVRPSIDFTPYLYTPLFYYVSAALAKVTGIGFLPLRLVSFGASLGSFALIYRIARDESGSWRTGVLAVGVFAATYRLSGAWFDLARVDSLYLFFVLAALYLVRFRPSWQAWSAAGLLLVLAYQTKQSGALIAAPLLAYALHADWRKGLVLAITTVAGIAGSSWLLNEATEGWYWYYTAGVSTGHPVERAFLTRFWTHDLLRHMWPACAIGTAFLVSRLVGRPRAPGSWCYPMAAAGMVGSAWMGRLHSGGWENVLIPAYAILAVLFSLGVHALHRHGQGRARALVAAVAPVVQLAILFYNPVAQVPSRADREAGERLLALLAQTPGEVWVFDHGYLPSLVGKPTHAPAAAIWDVLRGDWGPVPEQLWLEIDAAVRRARFSAIIVDTHREFPVEIDVAYREDRPLFRNSAVLFPVTGFQKRPEYLFTPWQGALASDVASPGTPAVE